MKIPPTPLRGFKQPFWDGRALDGKTLFVYSEQGLGDVIQFARYVPLMEARGGRVIFASSNHATGMYEKDHPYSAIVAGRYEGLDPTTIPYITTRMPIRPDGPYGIGKAFGEASGRYYSDEHGLSVICIRIGTVNKEPLPTNERRRATLLSHRDLVQLVSRCIDAPDDLRFSIFYGVSANKWRFWDIADSRSAIGYEPQDDASGMAIQG